MTRSVIHDIPLLVETGQADRFDAVVVVDAADDIRMERLVRGRGMSPTEAHGTHHCTGLAQ
jgi:dephospho-CoA kinase